MATIETSKPIPRARESLARIDAQIAALSNPRDRALLQIFRDHWWAEVVVDVDTLVALMPDDDAVYYFGGNGLMMPEAVEHRGPAAIRTMFQTIADMGVPVAGAIEDERFGFSDWGLMFEGVLSSIYPGKFLPGAPGVEPDQTYFVQWRIMSSYPVDLDRKVMLGGNVYIGSLLHIEPAPASAITIMNG